MATQNKHTPLSYQFTQGSHDDADWLEILSANGEALIQTHGTKRTKGELAEFITRACNSHYELVGVLQKACERGKWQGSETLLIEMQKAISRATGKEG